MLTLDALDTRLSVPTRQLAAPGPDAAQQARILRTAVRVPDHGKRVPFRFLRIAGPARAMLAAVAAERLRERTQSSVRPEAFTSRPDEASALAELRSVELAL